MRNECEVCGQKILVMIFRGAGLCSVRCEKVKLNEPPYFPELLAGGNLSDRIKRASHEEMA